VDLLVNVGSADDLIGVDLDGVEGIGLFRTELLFLDRAHEPDLEEQVAAYTRVLRAFPCPGPIVVRTLDAGADKPLPYLGLPAEANPALGLRGLRATRRHSSMLDSQLKAIAKAVADTGTDVWVMAPMVSTAVEAAAFTEQARDHGLTTAGVMVEVPAAALRARRLLDYADFLSIGTNDLSQYTFAADRQSGDLTDLLDPWQPALLQLVADCARAGHNAEKPVSVCGEAAADPLLAPILVGLGVRKLSMSPRSIPAVRAALAAHTLAHCQHMATLALAADDAHHARIAALSHR
jgi:phosphotransferase system enzyme I (PtsI)